MNEIDGMGNPRTVVLYYYCSTVLLLYGTFKKDEFPDETMNFRTNHHSSIILSPTTTTLRRFQQYVEK